MKCRILIRKDVTLVSMWIIDNNKSTIYNKKQDAQTIELGEH